MNVNMPVLCKTLKTFKENIQNDNFPYVFNNM